MLASVAAIFTAQSCNARVVDIERLRLTTSSLLATEVFYRAALGFRVVGHGTLDGPGAQRLLGLPQGAQTLTMQLGQDRVEFLSFAHHGRPYPRDSVSPDLWFQHFAIVVSDMNAAYARLRKSHFQPITVGGPQTLPSEDGRVRAFKFRDPDGHPLELIWFPPGQGRTLWAGTGDLTRGIDHTAICVSNTSQSVEFYERLLGMKIAYQVVNRGIAQEKLDDTFGAMVRITGLRPQLANGPGIELLDYRAPSSGRPRPLDSRANDLWHAEIVLKVDSLDATVASLDQSGVRFVSPGIVQLNDGRRAASVLDPDGHVVVIEQ